MVALPLVTIEGVHWARDGPKFVCKVAGCNASYTTKYNLVQHLWAHCNVTMEPGKLERPSTWEEGLKHQNHTTMNVHILNNLLAQFCRNEKKEIARAKKHVTLEWDKLQVDLQYTPEVPRPSLVKLDFSHIFRLFGMIIWGVGTILLNV